MIFFLILNVKLIVRRDWEKLIEEKYTEINMNDDLKREYHDILSIKDTDLLSDLSRSDKRKLMYIRGPYFRVFLP